MMRVLFCNIAWMKEYRGNEDGKDTPLNGGSYVDETGDAHEKYNFTPVNMEGREGLYCLGFFETKSHNGKDVNQMLFTYPVAGAPDKVIALLVGMVLFVVNEANRVENQVIMQMVFIDVSCQNKLILAA